LEEKAEKGNVDKRASSTAAGNTSGITRQSKMERSGIVGLCSTGSDKA